MVWNIPLVSWGQLSQLCPLTTSCAPPAPCWRGGVRSRKGLVLCVSTTQQQLKHPCIINTVSSTNPKHSPIPATMKKINSIPAKTSTAAHKSMHPPRSLQVTPPVQQMSCPAPVPSSPTVVTNPGAALGTFRMLHTSQRISSQEERSCFQIRSCSST